MCIVSHFSKNFYCYFQKIIENFLNFIIDWIYSNWKFNLHIFKNVHPYAAIHILIFRLSKSSLNIIPLMLICVCVIVNIKRISSVATTTDAYVLIHGRLFWKIKQRLLRRHGVNFFELRIFFLLFWSAVFFYFLNCTGWYKNVLLLSLVSAFLASFSGHTIHTWLPHTLAHEFRWSVTVTYINLLQWLCLFFPFFSFFLFNSIQFIVTFSSSSLSSASLIFFFYFLFQFSQNHKASGWK